MCNRTVLRVLLAEALLAEADLAETITPKYEQMMTTPTNTKTVYVKPLSRSSKIFWWKMACFAQKPCIKLLKGMVSRKSSIKRLIRWFTKQMAHMTATAVVVPLMVMMLACLSG